MHVPGVLRGVAGMTGGGAIGVGGGALIDGPNRLRLKRPVVDEGVADLALRVVGMASLCSFLAAVALPGRPPTSMVLGAGAFGAGVELSRTIIRS